MESLVGKVYAEALFELSCSQENEKIVQEELKQISEIFKENSDFLALLTNPSIARNEKISVIENVFGKNLSGITLDFIKLVCEKRRIHCFDSIQEEFESMYNEKYGIVSVIVKTAVPIKPVLLEKLTEKLQVAMGKTVQIQTVVDSTIIGGIVLEYSNYTVTSTVRARLDDIKNNLLGARV